MSFSRVAMSRKKKKSTRNDVAMAYVIKRLPGRVRKVDVFHTLIDFLDGEIAALPDGWEVDWRWRNSRKQPWRRDSIQGAVSNSRDSFMTLMRRRLQRDLNSIAPPRKRKRNTKRVSKRRRKRSKSAKKRARKANRRGVPAVRKFGGKRARRGRRRKA